MNRLAKILLISVLLLSISCSKKSYETNGETIYKTGKNLLGENLLDRNASKIKFIKSCVFCHGKQGNAMNKVKLQWRFLSNSTSLSVPYTDELFYRFLDHDLKSDGTKADIGLIWKMNNRDKKDLLDYIKKL
ncbi:hypothetical protein [Flavobacterium sp.]|uniref:hypothetical protein n=1 Tax=Flavobacterium sp. TaxID=239 RepID=UPI00326705C0